MPSPAKHPDQIYARRNQNNNLKQQNVLNMLQPRKGQIVKTQSKFVMSNPIIGMEDQSARNRSE